MKILKIPKNIKSIIFDMDGVIVNSEQIWHEKETEFIRQYIKDFPLKMPQKFIGRSIKDIMLILKQDYNLKVEQEKFLIEYRKFGIKNIYPNCNLSSSFLDFLKNAIQKYQIALASSSPYDWINFVLDKFDLRKYFKIIVSADDIDGVGKPSPDIYLYTAKQLNVNPQHCIVFEDSKNGVLSAKDAGMIVYGYRNGYNDDQNLEKADKIFNNFNEL